MKSFIPNNKDWVKSFWILKIFYFSLIARIHMFNILSVFLFEIDIWYLYDRLNYCFGVWISQERNTTVEHTFAFMHCRSAITFAVTNITNITTVSSRLNEIPVTMWFVFKSSSGQQGDKLIAHNKIPSFKEHSTAVAERTSRLSKSISELKQIDDRSIGQLACYTSKWLER